jgi:hypothetical protein
MSISAAMRKVDAVTQSGFQETRKPVGTVLKTAAGKSKGFGVPSKRFRVMKKIAFALLKVGEIALMMRKAKIKGGPKPALNS